MRPQRAQHCPLDASKLPPAGPREASHVIPTSVQQAYDPQPRSLQGSPEEPNNYQVYHSSPAHPQVAERLHPAEP